MCIQTLVSFCQFVLKILSKNQILTSIKGRNSLAHLRKTTIYYTKVDLVNDNVYTKFGLNRSIRFQDIEQKLNSDNLGGRTGLMVRASDSGSGDPGSILGRVGVFVSLSKRHLLPKSTGNTQE